MSNEIEYIEPTQEHVGQMVEVRDRKDREWQEAKLTGILADDFKFAAKRDSDASSWGWREARIPRPLTYAERQAKCGLKVGDRVRILRSFESYEDGCNVDWSSRCMDRMVGCTYTIDSIDDGLELDGLYWPYFVLEKIEDRVATHEDCGKSVYVDGAPDDVFGIEMIYGIEGDVWRAVVRSGDKRFVYELSNLRVKE